MPKNEIEFKIAKPGTQFKGLHLPVNCVYFTTNGHMYYIDDFDMVQCQQHFIINHIAPDKKRQRLYVDATAGVYRSLKRFICNRFDELKSPKKVILNREIVGKPKDRIVNYRFIQRAYGRQPNAMEERLLIDGCVVGHVRMSEEMYTYCVMGVR